MTRANSYRHTFECHKTAMTLDVALELSVEQLISALNKIFMECTRVRSTVAPTSRTLVTALTAEVRHGRRLKRKSFDAVVCRSTRWRNKQKMFCTK